MWTRPQVAEDDMRDETGVPAVARVLQQLLRQTATRPAGVPAWELARETALPDATVDMALAALEDANLVRVSRTSMGYLPTLAALHEAHVSLPTTTRTAA